LSYDFIIPILSKSYNIPQVLGSTSSHHLIKDPVTLTFDVVPVNPLRNCHELVLENNDGLIEILLKCRVKPIINARLLLNKSQVFFPLFHHQVCFPSVADFLPPIWIQGQPEDWSSHVNVRGGIDLLYIKSLFLLLTIITIIAITIIIFLFNLIISRCPVATSTIKVCNTPCYRKLNQVT
jgi:hypothetical protein